MPESSVDRRVNAFGSTLRRDAWWVEILPVVIILSLFGIYATFRAFEGKFYAWGPYLSPFYSPLIDPDHHWWRFSPPLLFPAGPPASLAPAYSLPHAHHPPFHPHPPPAP